MKIYIDAIEVQYPNKTLLEPSFSIRRSNSNSESSISFTGNLTFTGSDYTYLYDKLVADPNAITNHVILKFVDDCCGNKEYFFIIKSESLEWCENSCDIDATALEYSEDSAAYACIENTLIFDDHAGFYSSKIHPVVPYCTELRPSWLQDAMLIVGLCTISMVSVLLPVFLIIQTIINTINAVIAVINALGGSVNYLEILGSNDDTALLDWADNTTDALGSLIAGCNYAHPSPYVRSYIDNVCSKCGIAWSSSILKESDPSKPNRDYYRMVYLNAPVRKGMSAGDYFGGITNYINRNKPIHNLKSFLDEIKQVFNADWDIYQGTLRFERRDFFQNKTPWLDLTTYDPSKIKSVCYTWTKNPRPSYATFFYSKDAMDWVGSEAIDRWGATVEWNSPYSSLQKGEKKVMFPFGAARFRGDRIDRDVLDDYGWMPYGIGSAIINNAFVMIMNNGTAFLPKLLCLNDDGGSIPLHGIVRFGDSVSGEHANSCFNYPLWVRPGQTGNLYDRFWQIEDPRNVGFAGFDFIATIEFDCETLKNVDIDGTVLLSTGLGYDLSIDINFETNTMVIKGTV